MTPHVDCSIETPHKILVNFQILFAHSLDILRFLPPFQNNSLVFTGLKMTFSRFNTYKIIFLNHAGTVHGEVSKVITGIVFSNEMVAFQCDSPEHH